MRAFRLSTVERLRENDVAEAAQALASAQEAVRVAYSRCESLVNLAQLPTQATTAAEHETAALHRQRLRDELSEAMVEAQRCDEANDQARSIWLAARAKLNAVQSLHESHRAEVAREQARRDQAQADEAAAVSHRARSSHD